jgi:hypothetical protein
MVLDGDSNTEIFNEDYFNKNKSQTELFCDNAKNPSIFWNMKSCNNYNVILDFSCSNFKKK